MKEEKVIQSIEDQYNIEVRKIHSLHDEYVDHEANHTKRQQESEDPNLRLFRITSTQNILYELFCIHCRETMVSFQVHQSINPTIAA